MLKKFKTLRMLLHTTAGALRGIADALKDSSFVARVRLPDALISSPEPSQPPKQMRPFLTRGDFAPGSWGQAVVDELTRDKMFTRPAPLPERELELEYLERALKLKAPGLF